MNRQPIIDVSVIAILALSLFCFSSANAQQAIQPISIDKDRVMRRSNDYYIRLHGFNAKKQRLVHFDTDLIRSGGRFQLQLFDLEMDVETISVKESEAGNTIHWTGKLSNSTVSVEDFMAEFPSQKLAELVFDAVFAVKIRLSLYEIDAPTGAIFPVNQGGSGLSVAEFRAENLGRANLFFGASATIKDVQSGRTFRLSPLEMGSGIHLLTEVDLKKQLRSAHGRVLDPVELKRHEEAQNFLRSLGPDPRREILRERARNADETSKGVRQ